jgi:hypothetical protein
MLANANAKIVTAHDILALPAVLLLLDGCLTSGRLDPADFLSQSRSSTQE